MDDLTQLDAGISVEEPLKLFQLQYAQLQTQNLQLSKQLTTTQETLNNTQTALSNTQEMLSNTQKTLGKTQGKLKDTKIKLNQMSYDRDLCASGYRSADIDYDDDGLYWGWFEVKKPQHGESQIFNEYDTRKSVIRLIEEASDDFEPVQAWSLLPYGNKPRWYSSDHFLGDRCHVLPDEFSVKWGYKFDVDFGSTTPINVKKGVNDIDDSDRKKINCLDQDDNILNIITPAKPLFQHFDTEFLEFQNDSLIIRNSNFYIS
jgi:hypothetical protein